MEHEMAEVVPLFGERGRWVGEEPRIEVEVRSREWTQEERMRLARILFGGALRRVDPVAAAKAA